MDLVRAGGALGREVSAPPRPPAPPPPCTPGGPPCRLPGQGPTQPGTNPSTSPHSLQFTIWYRAYCKKFDALPREYQELSQPPAAFNQFSTPAGSIRTTASSLYGKDESWFGRLLRRRSTIGSRKEAQPEGEDSPDNDDDFTGLGVEMGERSSASPDKDKAFDLPGLTPTTPKEQSAAARIAATGQVPDSPSLGRTNTTISAFSDGDSINTEAIDRRAKRFPNLRFAGLAPLANKLSRQSEKSLPEDTPLPFVDEIQLIMTTFILPGSSKELNIDARLRRHILKSLRPIDENGEKHPPVTTHPDVFKDAADHVFALMERSLPHYMQWAKGNTNTPKRLFWTGVGIVDFGIGIMIAMIAMFFAHKRWWRLTSWIFVEFGVMQAYSAHKYFCSQVHGRTSRQLFPWELSDVLEEDNDITNPNSGAAPAFQSVKVMPTKAAGLEEKHAAELAASMPFLFEPEPASAGENADPFANPDARPTIAKKKAPAVFRSKWFASMRDKDGKTMKMFGPERVVEDPYIKYKHDQQMKEILWVGLAVTVVIEIILLAIPEQRRR